MGESFLTSFFSLHRKVALVTGAGRGLGRAMAIALAKAGADLVLVSRTETDLEEVRREIKGFDNERQILGVAADLTDFETIPTIVEKVMTTYGRIDILVNNAGRNIRKAAEDFSLQDWDAVMEINLKAVFLMAQTVGRIMISQKRGKIINIASLSSFIALSNMVAYCASRGGVQQLTKALALEWAKCGIQVNAIAPGYFLTRQTQPLFEDQTKKEWLLSRIPIGRIGDAMKDLGGVVVFLASPASDYITGQTIVVDGGWLSA